MAEMELLFTLTLTSKHKEIYAYIILCVWL
jgi:hypothetical protein